METAPFRWDMKQAGSPIILNPPGRAGQCGLIANLGQEARAIALNFVLLTE
jgi:hypothetical protein